MNTETLDTENPLEQYAPEELLSEFINKFNTMADEKDGQQTLLFLNTEKLIESETRNAQLQAQLDEANQKLTAQRDLLKISESNSIKAMALKAQLDTANDTIQQQRKLLNDYKGGNDPVKLKKRLEEQKEKNKGLIARNDLLVRDNRELRKERDNALSERNIAVNKVHETSVESIAESLPGIYHKGNDHILIMPNMLTMADSEGELFGGRALIYMHQSGCARLMTYNPDTQQSHICKSPRGGLKPSKETIEFAQNWLYKVNELQNGEITATDLRPADFNPKIKAPA
ncbi:hypothetical protein K6Y31_20575 [Motilimonas cestriensis]|uniref:Uncharacterized protein n=1 Tax=Motilimonas cestriensis TaxID=2742685 RepID=A0ABS8WFU0_9GAMM|nr:hypothetical protein [Motilimonas cestriensis]MCE2597173.1 hypothetical protein [Motilimonas cestriensis]